MIDYSVFPLRIHSFYTCVFSCALSDEGCASTLMINLNNYDDYDDDDNNNNSNSNYYH
jgi:hypothetical protein